MFQLLWPHTCLALEMTKEKFKRKIQVSDLDITLFSHHCVGIMVYNIYLYLFILKKKKKDESLLMLRLQYFNNRSYKLVKIEVINYKL